MKELIDKVENLARRVMKLETQETAQRYGLWASRPASPYNGQLYLANDSPASDGHGSILWEYSSTVGGWLSPEISLPLIVRDPNSGGGGDLSQATHTFDARIPNFNLSSSGWYLLKLHRAFFFRTAQAAGTFYSCSLITRGQAVSTTLTAPTDTKTYTTANRDEQAVDAYNVIVPNDKFRLEYAMSVGGGAPGIFFCWVTATFRIIG